MRLIDTLLGVAWIGDPSGLLFDFLMVGNDVYFSELTIYQGSGMNAGVVINQAIAGPATEPFYALIGRKWTLPQLPLRDLLRHGFLGG